MIANEKMEIGDSAATRQMNYKFGCQITHAKYTLEGAPLGESVMNKDLGVLVDQTLTSHFKTYKLHLESHLFIVKTTEKIVGATFTALYYWHLTSI